LEAAEASEEVALEAESDQAVDEETERGPETKPDGTRSRLGSPDASEEASREEITPGKEVTMPQVTTEEETTPIQKNKRGEVDELEDMKDSIDEEIQALEEEFRGDK